MTGLKSVRRAALAALLVGALSAQARDAGAPSAPAPVTVLKAAHLFDAAAGKIVSPGVVVVQDGKILAVGATAKVPDGAKIIDLGDATLSPGFIDAPVHMSGQDNGDWYKGFFDNLMEHPPELALRATVYTKAMVEAGFTTVRDLGDSDYISLGLRNAIKAGAVEGPRMLVANYAIGSTGGHADQDPIRPDILAQATPIKGVCNGPDECRAAVRYQMKYGADVIKFMPSGGVLSLADPVDVPQLTQDEMNAIVSEAHSWHRKVAAHCHGDLAAKMAIKAGVDSIEHGTFLQEDTLKLMKEKGVYLVPTLFATYWVGSHLDEYPPAIAEKARAAAAQSQKMFAMAVKAGTKVAFGTDAAVEPHGLGAKEFSLMISAGFTPVQALQAATVNAADLLGVSADSGTLEAGKRADIVVLAGNPIEDIHVTEHPKLVMAAGKIVRQDPVN
jgi:imidazolonepropionase-like amidohydrolase